MIKEIIQTTGLNREVVKMVVHGGIHVFVNSRKLTLKTDTITAADLIRQAGYPEPLHWDLYRLQSETDPRGILVSCDDTLKIRDGDWFRVVEGHKTCE
jgi:hypothetical protein